MGRRLTENRLNEILRRQNPPAWGAAYEPAIKPTREEAPGNSGVAAVWFAPLCRYISTLSEPERDVLAIILYCAILFELQEQRMLPFLEAQHPLATHPLAVGMVLPVFRGTLQVAEDLGVLKFHPVLWLKPDEDGTPAEAKPFPWIGDFLTFLLDKLGPYCVNFNVKSTRAAFSLPQIDVTPATNMTRAAAREVARQLVEEVLYGEVGIPTRRVAADELHPVLVANLRQLLLWQKRDAPFTGEQRDEVVEAFKAGMEKGHSALEVMQNLEASRNYGTYDTKTVMYQAIWHKQLRIDLFRYFFVDHPLVPESRSVMDLYGHWFIRT